MSEPLFPRRRWWRGLLILLLGGLGWTLIVCYPNPLVLLQNFSRYRHLPIDEDIAWSLGWNIPKDPKSIEKFVDAYITPAADWQTYRVPWYMPAAWEVAEDQRGDCESKTVLLASLLAGRHIPYTIRASFNHIWVDYEGRPEQPGERRSLAYLEGKKGRLKLRLPQVMELRQALRIQKELLWDEMPPYRKQAWLAGIIAVLAAALTATTRLPQLTIRSRCRRPVGFYVLCGALAIAATLFVMAVVLPGAHRVRLEWTPADMWEALTAALATGLSVTWLVWGTLRRRLAGVQVEEGALVVYTQRGPRRRARRLPAPDIHHLQLTVPAAKGRAWAVAAVLRDGRVVPLLCHRSEVAARRALRQLGLRLDLPVVVRSGEAEVEIGPEDIGRSLASRGGRVGLVAPLAPPPTTGLEVTQHDGLWRLGYAEADRRFRLVLLAMALFPAAACGLVTWLICLLPRSPLLWVAWVLAAAFLVTTTYLVIVLREEMIARLTGTKIEISDGELRVTGPDGRVRRAGLEEVESVEVYRLGRTEVLALVCFDRVIRISGLGEWPDIRWVRDMFVRAIVGAPSEAPANAAEPGEMGASA